MNAETKINFTRVNGDVYGNPRYVCHFLNLSENYNEALKIAHKIGGRKFNNKQYGGGIAFYGDPSQIESKIKQFSMIHNINPVK